MRIAKPCSLPGLFLWAWIFRSFFRLFRPGASLTECHECLKTWGIGLYLPSNPSPMLELASILLLFFNLGSGELVLIFAVILLLFGAKRIPELAKGLGKGIREFKDASSGIKKEIEKDAESEYEKRS